jgi:uncharacterized iron-regulated protein
MRIFQTMQLLILLIFLVLLPGCAITQALRVEDGATVDIRTMINEVSLVPVVLVGERHTSTVHHALQLEVLKGLQAKGKKIAIGMEMFDGAGQQALDAWSDGTLTTHDFTRVYEWSWRNIPYWYYRDIFNFARDNRIPIIALNAPREVVMKVSRQGLLSLDESDRRQLPVGVDAEVADEYLDFIRMSYGVHSKDTGQFRFICEAQMLRNRVMASRIRSYHLQQPEHIMVVIAGGGHVREKGGIPAELGTLPFRVILPPLPGINAQSVRSDDAHFLLEETFSLLDYL